MKKIVILAGSPREDSNSTAMADSFMKAAREKGHEVVMFKTAFMEIGNCMACERCYETGRACFYEDAFNEIAPAIEDADVVVFSSPIYWYSIPGNLKKVIDKFYSFVVSDKNFVGKECALLTCCEENDIAVLDGILIPYKKMTKFLRWHSIGEILIPGVGNTGEIVKTNGCEQAAQLVEQL